MNDESKYTELKHDCELQLREHILHKYINSGIFVELRRKIRKACIISESHPCSKKHFRSNYAIRAEQNKQLRENYYVIHPLSMLNLIRERTMIFVYILIYILAPFCIMLKTMELMVIKSIVDVLCITDFIISINTGYIIKTSNRIILQRKKIFRYKFIPSFLFDFISSINFSIPGFDYLFPDMDFNYFLVLKYCRCVTLLSFVDQYFEQTRFSFRTITVFKLVLLAIIVSIWCSIAINIANLYTQSMLYNVTDEHYIVIYYQEALFLLFMYGSKRMVDLISGITEIFILTIGIIFQLIVISQLVQIYKFSGSNNAFKKMSQQLEQFMRFRNLRNKLRKRLRLYFDFRFHEDYYKEASLLQMVSPQLHEEMLLHTHMYLLEKSTIFYDLPIHIMSSIIKYLKPEIYLPTDIIVSAGTLGECMFFLASGTVAVYTSAGKEVCHLSDGASFGELSMVMENEHRVANVVAIDTCEIFLFQRKDFLRELEEYPDVYERIRLLVQDKVRMTLIGSLDGDASSGQISNPSLLSKALSSGYIRI